MSEWKDISSALEAMGFENDFLAYESGKMAVMYYWKCGDHIYLNMSHVGGYECEEEVRTPSKWQPLPDPPKD